MNDIAQTVETFNLQRLQSIIESFVVLFILSALITFRYIVMTQLILLLKKIVYSLAVSA